MVNAVKLQHQTYPAAEQALQPGQIKTAIFGYSVEAERAKDREADI
jgi:hypothetical protein